MVRALLLLLFFGSVLGCASQGPLERSFDTALHRLANRDPPTKRRVAKVFAAYDALQARDFQEARQLEGNPLPTRWPALYPVYRDMQERLERIEPLLPLGATTNYRGGYSLPALRQRTEEARIGAGDYYHLLATALYARARTGDKLAARTAYNNLTTALTYVPERQPTYAAASAEMYDLGLVHISIYLSGEYELIDIAREVLRYRPPEREEWTVLHYQDYRGPVDFEAEIVLADVDSWGPRESTSSTTYTKEVLDYVEKQEYEERINDSTVVKKVREIEHFKTIEATVTEVEQSYELTVSGELLLYNLRHRNPELTSPLRGNGDWSNSYSVCSGDSDALPALACSGSASSPPSEDWLLREAIGDLLRDAHRTLNSGLLP